jgi:hypothetical protein
MSKLMMVDLPEPLGPTNAILSPGLMEKLMDFSTS